MLGEAVVAEVTQLGWVNAASDTGVIQEGHGFCLLEEIGSGFFCFLFNIFCFSHAKTHVKGGSRSSTKQI